MSQKLITVFGATGRQGESVVKHILKDGHFNVRAVTSKPNSDKAKQLKDKGCEVMKAEFSDYGSLLSATRGAYGCFLVTNFFASMSRSQETKDGKLAADACIQNRVQHVIFSGAENCLNDINIPVGHFESKADIEQHIKERKVPHTFVRVAMYMDNFASYMMPQKTSDGSSYAIAVPMSDIPLDLVAVEEIGGPIVAVFNNPQTYMGKAIGLSGGKYTMAEIADILSKHLAPKKFVDAKVTLDQYHSFGFPLAVEFGNMFEFYQRGNCVRDAELTNKLYHGNPTFDQWVAQNKHMLNTKLE